MTLMFVYGTLKRGKGNNRVMGDSEFIKEDMLKGFQMHSLGGFPAIVPYDFNPDNEHPKIVHGELFEVSDFDMERVNALEGYREKDMDHPFYDRTSVVLESGAVALVYYMHQCHQPVVENGVW